MSSLSAPAAELSVGDVHMVQGTVAALVVFGNISGESTFGVTILLELVPRAGATGTVEFTSAPTMDIAQVGDPWPGVGTFSPFDTDLTGSATINASVDDNSTFVAEEVTFSGALTSFSVVASADAQGVWDVLLLNPRGESGWTGLATTLTGGTITVLEPPDAPTQPDGEAGFVKNRYISLVAGNPGEQTSLRVTLVSLHHPVDPPPGTPDFSCFEGATAWVGEPEDVSEIAGRDYPSSPNFKVARLVSQQSAYWTDWSAVTGDCHGGVCWGSANEGASCSEDSKCVPAVIHVYEDEIVPSSIYHIQAIPEGCDLNEEGNYSTSLEIGTSLWGDVVGAKVSGEWLPPDGQVDVTRDVTAVMDKFQNRFDAPTKPRCDVDPDTPNLVVEIADVLKVNQAVGNSPYPFDGPEDGCP